MDASIDSETNKTVKFGARKLSAFDSTNTLIKPINTGLRGIFTQNMVTIGPVRQTLPAYAVTNRPVDEIGTERSFEMEVDLPITTYSVKADRKCTNHKNCDDQFDWCVQCIIHPDPSF